MDIEKLIERLKQKDGLWCSVPTGENLIADAATALSTLQAENEKLRGELEQVKRERAAAVEDVAAIIGDGDMLPPPIEAGASCSTAPTD